ncbi:MAG: hypothetical protein KatS3mg038_3836 [Candidatus Kapaibacterium sp.]|nr:MAG: hypothetical protein KatS3mg038_0349 [Candidatus Kapabacteria bacterium]GIV50214.1 MAG: hypothetical protein KatS3mg038_0735 [Candidatus Kapabacteria bacterium]GIV51118.1 MAG: hypothetical protein KatS3mg038_1639 [Candidatus Kapabacteria bacterium]GIV51882.1 MAG: hypothetical protein KatS3mg038_2403 [Candidatus Kapabacteria bacterium]GIV52579.1 MAG: hypothetical protein KatS3mg038_3100 [Candidatus Kapabacteria bacterium]
MKEILKAYNIPETTPEEIAAALNAKRIDVADSTSKTSAAIIAALGPDVARRLLAKFAQAAKADPLLQSQWERLNSVGIDFSHPLVAEMLSQLVTANVFTAEEKETILGLGKKRLSIWESINGEGAAVTPEEVQRQLAPKELQSVSVMLSLSSDLSPGTLNLTVMGIYTTGEREVLAGVRRLEDAPASTQDELTTLLEAFANVVTAMKAEYGAK